MKLKLKVLDPLLPRLKYPEDDRWNIEIKIEINEKLLLNLIEEITEYFAENKLPDLFDRYNWKDHISENNIDKMIKSARSWRRIQNHIQNEKCQTSRLTRISLFQQLMNIPNIRERISDRVEYFSKNYNNMTTPQLAPIPDKTVIKSNS
mgnify:CR=1 FL=1